MNRDAEIEFLLTEYLQAAESGSAPPLCEWVDRHPEYRHDLLEFFATRQDIDAIALPVRLRAESQMGPVSDTPTQFPLVFGRYTLLAELGRGGMGVVYRARLDHPIRLVALKQIRAGNLATADDRARFRREAEIASQLAHPLIVPVLDVGELDGNPYYTMPLLAGGDLPARKSQYMAAPKEAARLVCDLAMALHHAHQHGILHRDLKPSNILFDESGRPHISDFGLAKVVTGSSGLTQTGEFIGTPAYMSPELADGFPATAVSDVYGLGCLLFFGLTGRAPFEDSKLLAVLEQVRTEAPTSPRKINAIVHRDLEAICLKCLSKRPADRYSSADELAKDLDRHLTGKSVKARPVPAMIRGYRSIRRRPVQAMVLLLGGVITATSVGLAVNTWIRHIESQANLVAEEATLAALKADQAAIQSRADAAEFVITLEGLRQRRLDCVPGWPARNLEDLRRLAFTSVAKERSDLLRTEAVAALAATDLGEPRVVAEGFDAYAPAFSGDGQSLALGSWSADPTTHTCSVLILDPVTGREKHRLSYPADWDWEMKANLINKDGCRSILFSPDDRWLVVGTRSGSLVRWDLRNVSPDPIRWRHAPPEKAGSKEIRSERVMPLAFDGYGRLWSCSGLRVARWDAKGSWNEVSQTLKPADAQIELSRMAGREVINEASPWVDSVRTALAPDSELAARLDNASMISFLDRRCNLEVGRLAIPDYEITERHEITDFVFSPDGKFLATGAEHIHHLKLWETASGRLLASRTVPNGSAQLAFSSTGRLLALTSHQSTFLYELRRSAVTDIVTLQPDLIEHADISRDGQFAVTVAKSEFGRSELRTWQLGGIHSPPRRVHQDGDEAPFPYERRAIALSPDKQSLAVASNGELHQWKLAAVDSRLQITKGFPKALAIEYAPSGAIWVLNPDKLCRLSGDQQHVISSALPMTCFTVGEKDAIVGRADGCVCRYQIDGKCERLVCLEASAVTALSRSGDLIVAATESGTVFVIRSGAIVFKLSAHTQAVNSVAIGPRGWFATGSSDHTVRIWDPEGRLVMALPQSRGIRRMFWSADGQTLLVLVDYERALRRWHLNELKTELTAIGIDPNLP